MKVAVLFSGGKDSCLALHKVLNQGHDVRCLISVIPKNKDSFMFHDPYMCLLKRQAEELGIKLIIKESEGVKEEELVDLREVIEGVKNDADGIEGVVVGGIASSYQGNRIKKICDGLDLEFLAPIWDYDSETVWRELLDEDFEVILTKIACDGIPKKMIGPVIDEEGLEDLKRLGEKYKFRIDFEGGEAESAVLFMPEFKKRIEIRFDIESEGEYCHIMKNVELTN
jgi:diphthine-ammonia ligase